MRAIDIKPGMSVTITYYNSTLDGIIKGKPFKLFRISFCCVCACTGICYNVSVNSISERHRGSNQ